VRKTRVVPFGTETLLAVILSLALPLVPLVLVQVPFTEALRRVLAIIFGGYSS
jgi:hypothetical protein